MLRSACDQIRPQKRPRCPLKRPPSRPPLPASTATLIVIHSRRPTDASVSGA
jgi:hypothetical protein